jgi:hypothetical protein
MSADFELPMRNIALLVPFPFTPQQMSDQGRGNEFSSMIARLRPGATIDQVNAQMKTIVDRNLDRLPQFQSFARTSGFGLAEPIRQTLVGDDVRRQLYVLQAGVLIVLLIACANVANLLLMRATGRYRELAIPPLGAGRGRLVRQMLTESVVLSLFGGIAGLGLGLLGVRGLIALSSRQILGMATASLHPAVLAFTLALAIITGLVFGLVPALAVIRGNTSSLLKDDSARGRRARARGLPARRWLSPKRRRPGAARRRWSSHQELCASSERRSRVFHRERGNRADGASGIALCRPARDSRLLGSSAHQSPRDSRRDVGRAELQRSLQRQCLVRLVLIVGYTPARRKRRRTVARRWSGDYFKAMQIPVVAGRAFNEGDTADSPPVVVIDEYLVKRYFATRDPLGQQIRRGGPNPITIVGVVRTINAINLGEPVNKERLYRPVTQQAQRMMSLMIKTGVEPQSLVPQVRAAVQSIDP